MVILDLDGATQRLAPGVGSGAVSYLLQEFDNKTIACGLTRKMQAEQGQRGVGKDCGWLVTLVDNKAEETVREERTCKKQRA